MDKQIIRYTTSLNYILLLYLFIALSSCSQKEANTKTETSYHVAAYIWPSCHHDERFGDMLWPEGEGEWEIIKKGTPRFDGHYQPKLPLWGYEKDDDPEVMEKWIETATSHGVNVFIFDWYWFDEGPFLEGSLNNGFLKAKNNEKMKYYIMWANHDVRRNYWNVHQFANDTSIMWEGAVDLKNFKQIVARVIPKYFKTPNYFTINGEPVFYIFELNNFVKGMGGLENTRKAFQYFREEAQKAGLPGVHIQVRAHGGMNPAILSNRFCEGKDVNEVINYIGISSVTKYGWGIDEDYLKLGEETLRKRQILDSVLNVPYFPNVSIGWDDTPRFPAKTKKDVMHRNVSPESFGAFLHKAKEYCDEHPDHPNLITVFSWNEWVEGSYLLPDLKYGFSYLEEVKKQFPQNN
ncbi:glycoside hydrolase family 99-like domain-containing protein [Sunxiuqinia elliptica]|uniref:Glycosyl transferase family WbsX n=1 Tax=Sunxiuqinia elliptica TaxID=655355 RepID=A0A4R6GUP6_9BACT|nr:glycoside hydrolase family 99-like domain-containing protein [Sunxiuqinia elliptica]TDN99053.1 glycosyl transferase family WbsX [Sunxiuqinia elliptica]TDO56493.1 glycosyl transferase family WbsX [Sunxiuqinia elliptica]